MIKATHQDQSSLRSPRRRAVGAVSLATVVAFLLALGICGSAAAKAPIYSFSTDLSSTQAGGHPDLILHFEVGNQLTQPAVPCQCNIPRDIITQTPAGLIGITGDIPKCTASDFGRNRCPSDTQVGLSILSAPEGVGDFYVQPVYNLVPRTGELALLGGTTPFVPIPTIFTSVSVRTESDYGLEFKTFGIPTLAPPSYFTLLTWGVPGAASHDGLRFPLGSLKTMICSGGDQNPEEEIFADEFPAEDCFNYYREGGAPYAPDTRIPVNYPAAPFLANPTNCTGGLTASLESVAYDLETDYATTPWPTATGCDQLGFNPSLSAKPTTTETDSASGVDIDLKAPQFLSPTTPSPSQIRSTTVKFPPGFTLNSNAADGKSACTDADANFGTREAAECPEFAKIATLSIESSALPGPLPGYVYLGEPRPGNRYRVVLVADGFSLHLKLAGVATADPDTGQLTVSFNDLPQSPFQDFNLHFFGSERGLLATPTKCGVYPVEATFRPWDGDLPNQSSTQFFTIDSGPGGSPCPSVPRPFQPGFGAGVSDNTAGAHSSFVLNFSRNDGDQNLAGLSITTPPGFAATLKGVSYCSEAAIGRLGNPLYSGLLEQASPACPAASQVGTASATAGAGSRPLGIGGKVYLAGPYKGAPLSLMVVVPAVSGPYDLGNVAVRAALKIDPVTARVTAVSDPLPQIIEGIPLRARSVKVDLDRPGFALNPTNCDPFSITATVDGSEGARAARSSHFQVANCADLGFGPKLALRLSGGVRRTGHPGLKATLTARPGEANIARTVVTMPHALFLDSAHLSAPCTRVQYNANACPPSTVLGTARAESPLLDKPLEGPVYLRTSTNKLPDLVVALRGQFSVDVVGRVDSVKERLRTSFEAVPDVPISRFTLDLQGGRKGLLVNSENLCGAVQKARVVLGAQNGKTLKRATKLQIPCGSASRQKRGSERTRKVG